MLLIKISRIYVRFKSDINFCGLTVNKCRIFSLMPLYAASIKYKLNRIVFLLKVIRNKQVELIKFILLGRLFGSILLSRY